jgi:DNA-binding transcriptional LysR family regulator
MEVGNPIPQPTLLVAVAEAESLTLAAKSKLHDSQSSLSPQIRDFEEEIGAQLPMRTARGVELWRNGGDQLPKRAGYRRGFQL